MHLLLAMSDGKSLAAAGCDHPDLAHALVALHNGVIFAAGFALSVNLAFGLGRRAAPVREKRDPVTIGGPLRAGVMAAGSEWNQASLPAGLPVKPEIAAKTVLLPVGAAALNHHAKTVRRHSHRAEGNRPEKVI